MFFKQVPPWIYSPALCVKLCWSESRSETTLF